MAVPILSVVDGAVRVAYAGGTGMSATEVESAIDELANEKQNLLTGAWSSYTPALTAVTTNPTLGTASVATGTFIQLGRLVIGTAFIKFGTSGTAAGSGIYLVSLPVAGRTVTEDVLAMGVAQYFDNGPNATYFGQVRHRVGNTGVMQLKVQSTDLSGNFDNVTEAIPHAWGASDFITIQFIYEAASG